MPTTYINLFGINRNYFSVSVFGNRNGMLELETGHAVKDDLQI